VGFAFLIGVESLKRDGSYQGIALAMPKVKSPAARVEIDIPTSAPEGAVRFVA